MATQAPDDHPREGEAAPGSREARWFLLGGLSVAAAAAVWLATIFTIKDLIHPNGDWALLGAHGIGVAQVVYVLPLLYVAKHRGTPAFTKGVLVGAGVTLLVNAGVLAFVVWQLR